MILTIFVKNFGNVIVGGGIIFFVLELLARFYFRLVKRRRAFKITDGTLLDDAFADQDSYKSCPWYEAYKKEAREIFSRFIWSPYVYWVAEKYEGAYINVGKYHLRKTVSNYKQNDRSKIDVWFFGGSTVWGWGARDGFTIPSCFAKLANDNINHNVHVENHGQLGYVSSQEMIALIKCLQQGTVPGRVIFYNGLNDVFSAYQQHLAGIPQNETNRKISFELKPTLFSTFKKELQIMELLKFESVANASEPVLLSRSDSKFLAESVVDIYLSNIKIIMALADRFGFKVDFFWQPVLFYKNNRTQFEERLYTMSKFWKFFYDDVNAAIKYINYWPLNFHNLIELFLDQSKPIYIDPWHTNEEANQYIARRIYEDLGMS